MAKTNTEFLIQTHQQEIINVVDIKLKAITSGTEDYITAWKTLQDIAAIEIIKVLKRILPQDSIISSPTSKSTYPDIKIINSEGNFAIDIKANESSKDPWFDMARLDTMIDERINKYVEEWELVIKYNSTTGVFICCYFNLFREVVGIRTECNGIKYRPYDGKVRPKTWADFTNNKIYWNTKEEFINGIELSLKHRWKENIKAHLIPKLNEEEKNEFKKLFG
jgi:hypothetical protein